MRKFYSRFSLVAVFICLTFSSVALVNLGSNGVVQGQTGPTSRISVAQNSGIPSTNTGDRASTAPLNGHEGKFVVTYKGTEYFAEYLTREKVEQMKNQIGVRDPDKNYNTLVDGKGTGLAPPTEEEWNSMIGQTIIDGVALNAAGSFTGADSLPGSWDLSQEDYFPPVGDQGDQGSCAAWAVVYYAYGYEEAKDNGWNAKSGDPRYLMSPAWVYNMANGGADQGTWPQICGQILKDWGTATLSTMPYDENDATSRGSESAWREAPLHRAQLCNVLTYDGQNTVDTVKSLVAGGTPVTFGIDSSQLPRKIEDCVGNNMIFSSGEYSHTMVDHAQAIVGFDDSIGENGEIGSFKVVNSWGESWGLSGFYWLTYATFKEIGNKLDLRYITDMPDYQPQLLATWRFLIGPSSCSDLKVGIWDKNVKEPYCNHQSPLALPPFMALDISEILRTYQLQDNTFTLYVEGSGGIINSFRIERYFSHYTIGAPDKISGESYDVWKATPGGVHTILLYGPPVFTYVPADFTTYPGRVTASWIAEEVDYQHSDPVVGHYTIIKDDVQIQSGDWKNNQPIILGTTSNPGYNLGSPGTYRFICALTDAGLYYVYDTLVITVVSRPTGGGSGCPNMLVWNGTGFTDEGVLNIHNLVNPDSDVTVYHNLTTTPALNHHICTIQLAEIGAGYTESHSWIDQVKLYAVDKFGRWHLCPLISAVHSNDGNVKRLLMFNDDTLTQTFKGDYINLKFIVPNLHGIVGFVFMIDGHNYKW